MQTADKVLATLKRYAPAQVRAYVGDEARDIAVANVRKKWSRVVSTLDNMGAWSRVEMLDKKGALIHTLENTDPAGELQDIGHGGGKAAEVERMLQIVLKAQREAMAFKNEELQAVMRAQGEVVTQLTNSVRALSTVHQEQMNAMRELLDVRTSAATEAAIAQATDPEGNMVKQLVEAMPLIQAAMPLLKGILGQPDAPAAPPVANGARKH